MIRSLRKIVDWPIARRLGRICAFYDVALMLMSATAIYLHEKIK